MSKGSAVVVRLSVWLVGAALSVGFGHTGLQAQHRTCGNTYVGSILGTVHFRDDRGKPWGHGEIAPVSGAVVSLGDDSCLGVTNRDGRFLIEGVPDGLHVVEVRLPDGYVAYDSIRIAGNRVESEVVATLPHVVHDYAHFARRPKVLADPVGFEGCYWLGGVPNLQGTVLLLRSDGTAVGFGAPAAWEELSGPRAIRIATLRSIVWGRSATIEIGNAPEWSDLHVRYSDWSDMPSVYNPGYETFATRVACEEWGYTMQ